MRKNVPDRADVTIQSEPVLTITRVFDAPRDLVFRMWTQPEHVKHWWGPKIFTAPVAELDLRVGGTYLFCMQWPDGRRIFTAGEFREIVAPERLVMTQYFSDEHGNRLDPAVHGEDFASGIPAEIFLTVTLAERDGKTTMTIVQTIPASVAERVGAFEGWNQSLDKMAGHLAAL